MIRNIVFYGVAGSLTLSACSSRPREFVPTLNAATSDQQAVDAAFEECRQLLVAGKLDSSGRVASGAVGAAAGATTLAVGGAAASSAGLYGGMAVLSATVIALPFVAIAGAWGMSRAKRAKKEKAVKAALGGCLTERGYAVAQWQRAPKVSKIPPINAAVGATGSHP